MIGSEFIRKKLIHWFLKNTTLNENEILKDSDKNYLLDGWIDSFNFINLVAYLETEFNLTFLNNEFQDRDFATINGLIKIIEGKLNV